MGWGRVALEGVEIREISGDHVNMLVEPHVRVLAQKLRESVDQALAEHGLTPSGEAPQAEDSSEPARTA